MRKFLAENLQAVIADSAGSVEKFSVPFGRDMDFHDFFRNFGNRVQHVLMVCTVLRERIWELQKREVIPTTPPRNSFRKQPSL